jgi:hypothetical protein
MNQTYVVHVQSSVPLLLNTLTPEMLDSANKPPRGQAGEWEKANWRRKMQVIDGMVAIPGEYIERMMTDASAQISEKIPGRGNQTYTKLFKGAFFVTEQLIKTDVRADQVQPFIKPVGGQGAKKGAGKVLRYRPQLLSWSAIFTVQVCNDLITAEVLERVMEYGGKFVGIGDWRPKFGRVEFTIKPA